LQWTTNYLRDRGVENPRLDVEVLLAHACGCQRIDLYATFGEVASDQVRAAFREHVSKRAEGTPVAYLVGHREFYSLSFQVTPDVLIPRPETELLVVGVVDLAKEKGPANDLRIADVGTGSGNIAVTLAKYLPNATVTALDRCPAALDIAQANAERHGVADRMTFLESDLFTAKAAEQSFDFIVSNPPYVSEAEYERLPRDVKDHEPRSALVAGPRGTEVIERLIAQSAERIESGGWLLFEISPMIAESCRDLLGDTSQWVNVQVTKDVGGRARVVQARRSGGGAA
jgi:release factor glutamine methyltransferase